MKFHSEFLKVVVGVSALFCSVSSQAAIPFSHIKGVDELFKDEYKIYSPLTGMMSYRTFLYQFYGTEEELLANVMSELFSKVPGGEIVPTHRNINPGAHLSSVTIGKILVAFEESKSLSKDSEQSLFLFEKIREIIFSDQDFLYSEEKALNTFRSIQQELEVFRRKVWEQADQLSKAEQFKESQITPLDRKVTKLKKKLKNQAEETETLSAELSALETERAYLTRQYLEMKKEIFTRDEQKARERSLTHQLNMSDVDSEGYRSGKDEFARTLADSFIKYDLNSPSDPESRFGTTISLLSYLWMKGLSKTQLINYLDQISLSGALHSDLWKNALNHLHSFATDYYDDETYLKLKNQFMGTWLKERWTRQNLAAAVALSVDGPLNVKLPPVVSFSFVKWVAYSMFPDCCENALHNLMNLIAFNPRTGLFDDQILRKLKDRYYPDLSEKLIEFYRTYPEPDHDSRPIAAAWIQVVSDLNNGFESLPKDQQVHYRRARTHVASPYSNLIRVVNRLFGLQDINTDQMTEIFKNVRQISKFDVSYSAEDIDSEGYGSVIFKVHNEALELDAYRPVHVSFYQKRNATDGILNRVAGIFLKKANRTKKVSEVKKFRYEAGSKFLALIQQGTPIPSSSGSGTDPDAQKQAQPPTVPVRFDSALGSAQ